MMVDRSYVLRVPAAPALAIAIVLAVALAVGGSVAGAATEAAATGAAASPSGSAALAHFAAPTYGLGALYHGVVPYFDLDYASADGYVLSEACSVTARGGRGVVYARPHEPSLVVERPHHLVYEPLADGGLRLVAIEYQVDRAGWHDAGHGAAPSLFGEPFAEVTAAGGTAAYRLTVWIALVNPLGAFADANPLLRCGTAPPMAGDGLP